MRTICRCIGVLLECLLLWCALALCWAMFEVTGEVGLTAVMCLGGGSLSKSKCEPDSWLT